METVLRLSEQLFMSALYKQLPSPASELFSDRNSPIRQATSLWVIATVGGLLLYFGFSLVAFYTYFDRSLMKHPKVVKNQISREITLSMYQIPIGALLMVPFWLAEVNGYSKVYYSIEEWGWPFFFMSFFTFLVFSDFWIYWIHRWEHNPAVYYWLHKPHHTWKIPTPFSSFAFHPLDGFFQSLPYHIYPFLFPLQAGLHVGLFIFVQMWTLGIHDNAFWTANHYINGAAHHTIHHLEFNYNYGQYFTLWDRLFGTHRFPDSDQDVVDYFDKALFTEKRVEKKEE